MGRYLICDVERMYGVKRHVLRRWESKLPLFSPDKDYQGRRSYGERDLETIVRMKHLVYDRGLSEEEAARLMLSGTEAGLANVASLTELREIRELLENLYLLLKKRDMKGSYGTDEQ